MKTLKHKSKITFDISFSSIFWILFSLLIVRFFANIVDILFLVFIAILITLAICPVVDWLEKRRIPRALSSITILLSVFTIIIVSAASIAAPLAEQTTSFLSKLPGIISNLFPSQVDMSEILPQLNFLPSQFYRLAVGTASGILTAFAVIVISYYMIQDLHNLPKYFEFWFGKNKGDRYFGITKKLEEQIGNWVRGEILLMVSVGLLSYLGYLIIGLPDTVALGVIAGILELIPNIGPTVATVPAVLIGYSISPTHAIAALVVSIIVQQVENNLLVPKIMQKTIGLNPVITIIALMIGLRLGGPMLAVIILPLILSARVVLSHIRVNKETNIPEIT